MDIEQDCDGDLDDNEDKENINKVLSVYFDGKSTLLTIL